jgi:hypothetical protein
MKSKVQIEAALDRSLRQLTQPRLDSRFNAAVWQRIAAEEMKAPAARRSAPAGSRWLLASNVIGIAVSVVLILYFVIGGLSGVEMSLSLPAVALPEVSAATDARLMSLMIWGITIASMALAFAFTGMGRRVGQMLRSEFA